MTTEGGTVSDHDYFEPKLRVRASGYGGSGYRIPTRLGDDGKPIIVPGVTTVLGALDKGGITQWAVDSTVAYMIANIDALLSRTEEQGFRFGRFYHARKPDFDDPAVDLNNIHNGVLNDLAELGTFMHDYVSYDLLGMFAPEPVREEQEQMIEAWEQFRSEHDIVPLAVEKTVVGENWAGTLDGIWEIDGVPTLTDIKTARAVRESHLAQLAILGAAQSMMTEVDKSDPDGVEYETKKWGKTYWKEEPVPSFKKYAIVQLRPDDVTNQGEFIPAFCEMHEVSQAKVEAAFEIFQGALRVRHGQNQLKEAMK